MGFVANTRSGTIVPLDLKQGTLLSDNISAPFMLPRVVATGDQRQLGEIAAWAPTEETITLFATDLNYNVLLVAPYIIGMVERQLRLLALAWDSMDKGVPQRELGSRLGVTSDFVVRKTVDQARRHSWPDIVWRYNRLLEADLAIKQGRLEPDLALELLAGEQAPA